MTASTYYTKAFCVRCLKDCAAEYNADRIRRSESLRFPMKENMSKSQFPKTPSNRWPPMKESLLRDHYATMPWPELIALLGRTRWAIYGKAHTLGLIRIEKTVRHEGQNFTLGRPRVGVLKHAGPTVAREAPVRNGNAKGTYSGAELQPFAGRPGAMDAYALPSLAGSRRTYRDGRVEAA